MKIRALCLVASNDIGRARVDADKRRMELSMAIGEEDPFSLGTDVVALPDAEASPPAGKVGVFQDGPRSRTVVVLDATGKRLFLRYADGVHSTNVGYFVGWDAGHL